MCTKLTATKKIAVLFFLHGVSPTINEVGEAIPCTRNGTKNSVATGNVTTPTVKGCHFAALLFSKVDAKENAPVERRTYTTPKPAHPLRCWSSSFFSAIVDGCIIMSDLYFTDER